MIKVKNITKKYGSNIAIKDISFEIEKGEVVGFLGPNGAGKSTTMNIITGSTVSNEGTVEIDGLDINKRTDKIKKNIGYMSEQLPLYLEMTVYEYLKFVCELKKVNSKEIKEEINRVMKDTSLEKVASRLIRNLSRGFKQRVGLAQALVGNPELLILDEPTVGLDPNQIVEIRQLIKKLAGKHTVILSTHILPEVEQVCDRVIIIKNGSIVSDSKISDLSKMANETVTIQTVIEGNKDKVLEILKSIKEVDSVNVISNNGDETKYELISKDEKTIRKSIFKAFEYTQFEVLELHKLEVNLENIFVELTK